MTKAVDPYTRVYWRAIDDPKFAGVWADDAALSAWLRLLVAADMAWPASASLYHGIRRAALDRLVLAGLVDVVSGHRYRIHGLDRERGMRSDLGRAAINARWHGSPQGMPSSGEDYGPDTDGAYEYPASSTEGIPSRAEQSRAEPSKAREGLPNIDDETQRVGEAVTRTMITTAGDRQLTELDRQCEAHGPDQVRDAMRKRALAGPATWTQLVWDCRRILEPFMSNGQAKADERADRAEAERAAFARTVEATKRRNAELTGQR